MGATERTMADPNKDLSDLEAPEWLLRYTAEIVYNSRRARLMATISTAAVLIFLIIITPLSITAIRNAVGREELAANTTQQRKELKASTVAQDLKTCRSRNIDRRVQRKILRAQIRQTKPIPAEAFTTTFAAFDITKAELLKNYRGYLAAEHRIDCQKFVSSG